MRAPKRPGSPKACDASPNSSEPPCHYRRYGPLKLMDGQVAALIEAAAGVGRHGTRDAALILIAYRHGLRVSELVSLRWDQVDLRQGLLHVTRPKHGIASLHPSRGPELRILRRLQRDYRDTAYAFVSEQFSVHPHMLRHATGYGLANDGQDTQAIQHYLGHRNIQHTTRYTELASDRFRALWSG